jgi:hypothetical protein
MCGAGTIEISQTTRSSDLALAIHAFYRAGRIGRNTVRYIFTSPSARPMICIHDVSVLEGLLPRSQSIGSSNRIRAGGLHGQSLDHPHASTTAGAPGRVGGRANRLLDLASMGAIWPLSGGQQSATLRELGSPMCVGEQAIVADTTKTGGKNMKKKPTNEFCDLKSHDTSVVTSLPLMALADAGQPGGCSQWPECAVPDRPGSAAAPRWPACCEQPISSRGGIEVCEKTSWHR